MLASLLTFTGTHQGGSNTLYRAGISLKDQSISLNSWGSGICSETEEDAFEGSTSIRVTTKNLFQGGILNWDKSVDLSSLYSDKANLLRITYKSLDTSVSSGSGSGKGGGVTPGVGGGGKGKGGGGGGAGDGDPQANNGNDDINGQNNEPFDPLGQFGGPPSGGKGQGGNRGPGGPPTGGPQGPGGQGFGAGSTSATSTLFQQQRLSQLTGVGSKQEFRYKQSRDLTRRTRSSRTSALAEMFRPRST